MMHGPINISVEQLGMANIKKIYIKILRQKIIETLLCQGHNTSHL